MRNQVNCSSVNVEVDARPQEDLNSVLNEIRSQYESITDKNRREMEEWYKVKVRPQSVHSVWPTCCCEVTL